MHVSERQPGDIEQLRERVRRERDVDQRDRYRCVLLALQKHPTLDIADRVGRCRAFVQNWVYAYRDRGLEAIGAKPCGGSKARLSDAQQREFIERFKAGPGKTDGGVCTLRGRDAVRILQQEFGHEYSLNGVYALLHRHGLSCLRPRPRHRKQNPDAQQQWLDRAPLLSRK